MPNAFDRSQYGQLGRFALTPLPSDCSIFDTMGSDGAVLRVEGSGAKD
jgi:hypothetical protein